MLKRQTRTQVAAALKKRGWWEGYLAGNAVDGWNVDKGWAVGCLVALYSLGDLDEASASHLAGLAHEEGNRTAYWEVV